MKKIKNCLLSTFFLATFVGLVPTNASAYCTVCWGSDCYEIEGNCSDVCCSFQPASCSCEGAFAFNPNTDYILAEKNKPVYIVRGGIKKRVATDNMAAFHKSLNQKYAKASRNDPKINKEIADAWAGFFKKPDTSKVSAKRLDILSKETKLSIHTK